MPTPRDLTAVLREEGLLPKEATVMIPLLIDAGRTVRANLTFDSGLLSAVDEAAAGRGPTRSAFLASAAREKIESHR